MDAGDVRTIGCEILVNNGLCLEKPRMDKRHSRFIFLYSSYLRIKLLSKWKEKDLKV